MVRPYTDRITGESITNMGLIFCNYLKFWFWIDAMSCIPFDIIDWYTHRVSIAYHSTTIQVHTIFEASCYKNNTIFNVLILPN